MPKNIILNSLKQSFVLIWKNKSLFILLFILQIVFFSVFFFINLKYQTRILENAKAISDYLSQQKLDEVSVASDILQQKNILGDDPLIISRNFNELVKNFRLYLIYIFILLVIFISLFWAITIRLLHKIRLKQAINILLKNLVVILFYLGLIFSFFYSVFNVTLAEAAAQGTGIFVKYVPFLILATILIYFMFISLSLLNKTELKYIVQKTLAIGIKKAHYMILVYFINIFLILVSVFSLFYFIEINFFIVFLSIVLMIFSFVFGRILIVNVVEKLEI